MTMRVWRRFLLVFALVVTSGQFVVDCNGKDAENIARRKDQRSTSRSLEDLRPQIDDYVNSAMTAGRVPGLSLAIVYGDVDSLTAGYGVMNIDSGDVVDASTLFMIGSTTKAMTAALLLQTLREYNISLDTPVKEILPDFQVADFYRQQSANIYDLLAHRMGIPESIGNYLFGDVVSRKDLVQRALYFKPLLPYRSSYFYSNLFYVVAGRIIEKLTGKTWEEATREKLYAPLHMDDSTFYNHLNSEQQSRLVTPYEPYRRTSGSGIVMREVLPDYYKHLDIGGPSCCAVTNAADLVHWLYTLTHSGLNEDSQRVLDEQVVMAVMSPYSIRRVQSGTEPFASASDNYGLGWATGFYLGYRMARHDGYVIGYRSSATIYPELKLGIFTCVNGQLTTSDPMSDIHQYVTELLLNVTEWRHDVTNDAPAADASRPNTSSSVSHVTAPSFDQFEKVIVDVNGHQSNSDRSLSGTARDQFLEEHVGVYGNFAFGNITIELDNSTGRLRGHYGDTLKVDLFHVADERFLGQLSEVVWFYPLTELTFSRDPNDNTVVDVTVPILLQDDPPVFVRGLLRSEAPLPPTCGPC